MNLLGSLWVRLIQLAARKTFDFWQFLGFHITPNHYYQPIPDTRTLNSDLWENPGKMPGIDLREDYQLNLLKTFEENFGGEFNSFSRKKTSTPHEFYSDNNSFAIVDAAILYCMVRHFKPAKIFEIGSGFSTFVSAKAALVNEKETGAKTELVAFEPYPNEIIKKGFEGLSKLEAKIIQQVDTSAFLALKENDILFIDSSHVLKTGSDVQYEYLEILPRLNKGVIIHCHDIFLPLEYPEKWLKKDRWFWTEQYLLQAFLAFNESYEVLWGGSFMNFKHGDLLEKTFKSCNKKDWPGSFWLRKIK
ncbi:MAG: hypothetical protein A2204_03200 [Elusimicrobia bacterium RIFOXYA1_FULL_47_7]|nr:MAG: hypothetical protein A2278_01715 [Elusimicrobia bacterium RIFOXYA12_FULL_49_49]OGS09067.1 MAG: hypothetical protein A2204_03200 [Elusimicrobia bacterium RIFOXYA1_FULL_47_7]OGS11657.1 MAG: hypothetical protein A2386_03260 [Elusimicrobia bacterium RIFOXYB1_FULL_48_9]OGS16766.1 MAG: hypothetical protein A2251_05165 [Elusimicrobia bacterium RIFOXYA2_FULL_47_53]OGS31994.1 MAG: hypothetical protein A2323_07940 [Elusimicrobia bacterium RIFOXYB2_FULL_46_23]